MNTIYFIYRAYVPNRASTNRALGYLRALSSYGVPVEVLFLLPDENYSKIKEHYEGINIEYCWENHYYNNRFLKQLSYVRYLLGIYKKLKKGDIVYTYSDIDLFPLVRSKKGVKLFHEITEHPLVHPPKGILFNWGIKRYCKWCSKLDGLFVISTTLKDFFVTNGVPEEKVGIVNMTVDPLRFDGLQKESGEKYFAYCGNGNNRKDKVDDLIRAFALIAKRYDDINFKIIGPTKQTYKEEQDNLSLVHQLGLDNRVIFTGMKPAEEIPALLVNAAGLFLTRPDNLQNQAGFPTKLGEYLLSGNPVVVAGVGDIPNFLTNGVDAYVYSPGDMNAVINAMDDILENPIRAHQIGASGKDIANKCFNVNVETLKLIKAFGIQIPINN